MDSSYNFLKCEKTKARLQNKNNIVHSCYENFANIFCIMNYYMVYDLINFDNTPTQKRHLLSYMYINYYYYYYYCIMHHEVEAPEENFSAKKR